MLQDRLALAMQWGWPTPDERAQVVRDSQGARWLADLPLETQNMVHRWEENPRMTPLGPVSETLRKQLREAREQ
jgi:hypothetical protein